MNFFGTKSFNWNKNLVLLILLLLSFWFLDDKSRTPKWIILEVLPVFSWWNPMVMGITCDNFWQSIFSPCFGLCPDAAPWWMVVEDLFLDLKSIALLFGLGFWCFSTQWGEQVIYFFHGTMVELFKSLMIINMHSALILLVIEGQCDTCTHATRTDDGKFTFVFLPSPVCEGNGPWPLN